MLRAIRVLCLIFTLALTGCWQGTTRSVCATVLSATGKVSIFEKSGGAVAIGLRSKICPGVVLRTSGDAVVDLQLIPGALAQVSSDSDLKIEDLKLTKDGNETGEAMRERQARLELNHGKMIVLFEGFAHFEIRTPETIISVLPSCLFKLDVDQTRTRVTCIRGKLYATSTRNGQRGPVETGYFREWPSDQAAVSVNEDRQAQMDVTATLQTGRELGERASAQQDRLPF